MAAPASMPKPVGAEAAAGAAPALNVIDLPLTVKLSPSVTVAVPRPGEAPPVLLSRVAAVIAAGAVAVSLTAVPVSTPERPPTVRL